MDKEYKYTANNSTLSDEQRQFYEENGYIVIKKLIPDSNLDKCYERFLQACNGDTANVSNISRISELKRRGLKDEYTINKIHGIVHDPTFFDNYISHESIIKVVASIIGPNIAAFNSMIINKPPNTPYKYSRHVPHQDQHYNPFGPPNRVVGSWTAMENVTEENGCLFVLPGSHKGKLYPHDNLKDVNTQFYHRVKGFDESPRVNLLMEKGDTVFFHPLLIHGSGPNCSKGFRKAISVHYADTNCYAADVKGTTSENVEKEILEAFRRSGTNYNNLAHYYKSRSRLIAGRPGNFQDI